MLPGPRSQPSAWPAAAWHRCHSGISGEHSAAEREVGKLGAVLWPATLQGMLMVPPTQPASRAEECSWSETTAVAV